MAGRGQTAVGSASLLHPEAWEHTFTRKKETLAGGTFQGAVAAG